MLIFLLSSSFSILLCYIHLNPQPPEQALTSSQGVGVAVPPTPERTITPPTSDRITSLPISLTPIRHEEFSPLSPARAMPPPPLIDNFILQVATNTFSNLPSPPSVPSTTENKSNNTHPDSVSNALPSNHTTLKPFQPNSRQAVPFENDYFVGKILFVVRTKPLDPFYKHFFEHNKDRMYIVQLQGKFKVPPENASSMYMGKMEE